MFNRCRFFSTLASFAKSFKAAVDELERRRIEEARKQLGHAAVSGTGNKTTAVDSNVDSKLSNLSGNDGNRNNLFDKYNAAKTASSDSMVEEFKRKMQRQANKKLFE